MKITRNGVISEEFFGERLFAAEYINDAAIPHFSLARCRVEPNVTTQLHSLSVDEWYVIESGAGLMELDGQQQTVGAGSVVQIPHGYPQRITNSEQSDLIFFCVCMPRFTPDCYTALE